MKNAHVRTVTLVGRVGVAEEVLSLLANSVLVSADKELRRVVGMGIVWV